MTKGRLSFFDDLFGSPLPDKSYIGNKAFSDFEDAFSLDESIKKKTVIQNKIPIGLVEEQSSSNPLLSEFSDFNFFDDLDSKLFLPNRDLPNEEEIIFDEFREFNYDSLNSFHESNNVEDSEDIPDVIPEVFEDIDLSLNEEKDITQNINNKLENNDIEDSESSNDVMKHVQSIFDNISFSEIRSEAQISSSNPNFSHEQRKAWIDFSETLHMLMK